MAKGADFEREMCKYLSLWWTSDGRDDVFWRSQNSGGRATVRGRQGKDTHGQAGDIAAMHPCGEAFLETFAVELKRGYKLADPFRMIDGPAKQATQIWEEWISQVQASQELSGAASWLIINKRDRRAPLAAVPTSFFARRPVIARPWAIFHIEVDGWPVSFVQGPVDNMLTAIKAELQTKGDFYEEDDSDR